MIKHFIAIVAALTLFTAAFANTTYKVKAGDNDHTIARKFGITVKELHDKNPGIDWSKLPIGTSLTIRVETTKKAERPSAAQSTQVHTVKAGENSWTISQTYGITERRLKELNPNTSFSPLHIGAKLNVPARRSVTVSAPKPAPAPAPVVETQPATRFPVIRTENAMTSRDAVIVRGAPSIDAKRLTTVDRFTIGKITERRGDWYKLQFSWGGHGWVRGDLLVGTDKSIPKAAPKPATPAPRPATKQTTSSISSLISTARSQIGIRYVWGGTSRRGFDCSGFVGYVFRQHGISLPRTSSEQARVGVPVSRANLQAGDLVFFRTRGSRISHVGIWLGNNQFIHASSGGGRIRVDSLAGYYSARYVSARRVTSKLASIRSDDYASLRYEEPTYTVPDPEPLPDTAGPKTNLGADVIAR